jgi:hypothetical protein
MSSARTCASSMVYRRRLRAPARADLPVANDTIGITFEKRSSGGGGGGRRRHDTHNRLGATVQRHRQHAGVCARVRRRRSKESKKDGTKLLRARAREREREREMAPGKVSQVESDMAVRQRERVFRHLSSV